MVTNPNRQRRARHGTLIIGAILLVLGVSSAPGSASAGAERQGAQLLQRVQAGELKCQGLSRAQSESVGEYVMGRMLGSPARHEAMDRQIRATSGASGEAQAHAFMGQRFTGCETGAVPAAFGSMMGMMGGYSGANGAGMSYGRDAGNGMMGGSDPRASGDGWSGGSTALVLLLGVLATGLAILAASLSGRRRSPTQTPGDILKDRYARGDIDTADYEQRRIALGSGLT